MCSKGQELGLPGTRMSAIDEVTDLVEQRESLPAEGFHALVSLKDSESERDKR